MRTYSSIEINTTKHNYVEIYIHHRTGEVRLFERAHVSDVLKIRELLGYITFWQQAGEVLEFHME